MSVFKRSSDGRWCAQWRENGKVKRRYFQEERAAHFFEEERKAAPQEPKALTVGELAIMYKRSKKIHPDTLRKIRYLLAGSNDGHGRHREGPGEFLRDKQAERLNRLDLEQLRKNCHERGTGNNTTNKYQTMIRAILSWGLEQQLIAVNPWGQFKKLPVEQRIPRATLMDFQQIISVSPDWLKWALATAYALALRPGMVELFSLTWSAFNWQRGVVVLRQGKTGRPKTVMPPHSYMQEALRRFTEDRGRGITLVVHRKGKPVVNYAIAWRKALKDAGLEGRDIRPYDLRHVAASEMLAAGADLAAVSAQLGHASVLTTARTYTQVTPGAQRRAAALMPEIMDSDCAPTPDELSARKKA